MTFDDFAFVLIPILVLIGLLETILSAFWVPFYMRLGIPTWWQSTQVLSKEEFRQTVKKLDSTELLGTWYPTVTFKQIGPNELAFRNKMWGRRAGFRLRSPVRGIVRLKDEAYTITITNYLPWATPAVLIFFLWIFRSENMPEFANGSGMSFLVFILFIIALTFGLQLVVFRQINNRILALIEQSH